ncbi:MAG TPA: outer membrane beta-barrel protein [Ignavibacteriaceae bacterium]|nr:outer membrane beta-barrel protein [Ignavibacteriaceae bacterium]
MFKNLILIVTIASTLSVKAQSDFAVGLSGNVNFPNGKFTEYFGTGYGGDAHFLYLFGNSSIFTLAIGYNQFGLDNDAFTAKANESGVDATFNIESKFSTIPILLGVKWYFLKQKTQSPYIMIEAGFYNYNFTFKGMATLVEPGGNSIPIELPEFDENGTETMLRVSAGYIFFIQKHWFIDASINYIVLTDAFTVDVPDDPEDAGEITGAAETLNYLSVTAGINYRF